MIFNKQGATIKKLKFYFQRQEIEIVKQCTYLEFTFLPSGKKHQGIEYVIKKTKKSWFILQLILCKSEGKTVNTNLKLIDTTIKPAVLYGCKSWGDPKDQNNLSKIEKFHLSLCKQILGVKYSTSSSKVLRKLIIPFVKEDCYLRKVFNQELANKESGWVTKMRHLPNSYGMSNFISNIFKVYHEIDKKEYKNKHKFFQK